MRLLPLFLSLFYFLNLKKFITIIILFFGFFIFLSSERTALFLYLIILIFYFFIIKDKLKFLIISFLVIFVIFSFNEKLRFKYVDYTLQQFGFYETDWNKDYQGKKGIIQKNMRICH